MKSYLKKQSEPKCQTSWYKIKMPGPGCETSRESSHGWSCSDGLRSSGPSTSPGDDTKPQMQ